MKSTLHEILKEWNNWECCPQDEERKKMKMKYCKQGPQLVANPNGKRNVNVNGV
jgi:hypothetical protein